MSKQRTLWDIDNATFLQAFQGGHSPCDLPESQTTSSLTQQVCPASHSPLPENREEKTTRDTCGQSILNLPDSEDRIGSSESRSLPLEQSGDLLERKRTCKKCGTEKPYSRFYVNSKGHRRLVCMDCTNVAKRIYKRANPLQTAKLFKSWRDKKRGHALVVIARNRAKMKCLDFDLDPVLIQRTINNGFCELTGIPFNLDTPYSWNAPSLDRIDSTKGYTMDNMRVVLYAVNVMANTWGEQKIVEIAAAIMDRRSAASSDLQKRLHQILQKKLGGGECGSMEYSQIWKEKVTPAGRSYWEHTASSRHTSGSESTGALSGYVTPSTRDYKDTPGMSHTGVNPDGSERLRMDQLPRQIHGMITPSANSETENPGVMDPAFPRWLMGFPEAWDRSSPNFAEWQKVQAVIEQDE